MNGTVKFTLGGVQRSVRVELEQAAEIEEATGTGCIALARGLADGTARLTAVVEVLRVALAANGTRFSSGEVLGLIKLDGVMRAYGSARMIIAELFREPGGKGRPARDAEPDPAVPQAPAEPTLI